MKVVVNAEALNSLLAAVDNNVRYNVLVAKVRSSIRHFEEKETSKEVVDTFAEVDVQFTDYPPATRDFNS